MNRGSAVGHTGAHARSTGGLCGELETQDWLLVFEALVAWADPLEDAARGTIDTPRKRRAWELTDRIAAEVGLPIDELLFQTDEEWSGPSTEK